ncbi:MAG TPA: serine hydrolase domain-containing protein [Steroidobacteraceae bacterium]|nr:serine hydrolase domain-containing protein [Steroidobacteraceae bacterium]
MIRKLLGGMGRVRVPHDVGVVTRIDYAAEARPEDVGLAPKKVARIWHQVEQLYRTGLHPAITLVIRRHGRIVMKRAIGCVAGNAPNDHRPMVPLQPDSPICLFSASKAITALLIHKLSELGALRLEDRVSHHLPEFAANGKEKVTIRQLLAHRAGIPSIPFDDPQPELLHDWPGMVKALCAAAPDRKQFERQAYHALTSGFIIGELAQRVSGRSLREMLREWIAEPLGCKVLDYGLAPELRPLAPPNVCTGPRPFWPITVYAHRIMGVPFERAVEMSNHDAFLSTVVPAGNIFATAEEASRVFQMLLDQGRWNGRQVMRADTVAEAIRPIGPIALDGMLRVPLRFSAGFMLGENPFGLYGPGCKDAFGHLGFVSVLTWADPRRDMVVALLTTGKSVSPTGVTRLARLLGAINGGLPVLGEGERPAVAAAQ